MQRLFWAAAIAAGFAGVQPYSAVAQTSAAAMAPSTAGAADISSVSKKTKTKGTRGGAAGAQADDVGSIKGDGQGFSTTRSGQRLQGCVIDLGYGRTKRCD